MFFWMASCDVFSNKELDGREYNVGEVGRRLATNEINPTSSFFENISAVFRNVALHSK